MLAKLLLLVAPFLVPAFLSLAFIDLDAGVLGARSTVHPSVATARPAVAAASLVEARRFFTTPEAAHGKAHASCPGRKAPEAPARPAA